MPEHKQTKKQKKDQGKEEKSEKISVLANKKQIINKLCARHYIGELKRRVRMITILVVKAMYLYSRVALLIRMLGVT